MRVLVILPVLKAKETRVEPDPDRTPGQAHDGGVAKRVGVDVVALGCGRDGLARGGELLTVVSSAQSSTPQYESSTKEMDEDSHAPK